MAKYEHHDDVEQEGLLDGYGISAFNSRLTKSGTRIGSRDDEDDDDNGVNVVVPSNDKEGLRRTDRQQRLRWIFRSAVPTSMYSNGSLGVVVGRCDGDDGRRRRTFQTES